ncbi:unnamed protein product [Spirodela intermedia]|uniref:Uncharacterized protein n=2 Tax=Spirodela intermedia TaxID=51605 RepID=A0A7I8K556_SPIIN|nr:unnamed protein product [Spirodela intermedia]CAA6656570.1 unnamed protein product [Spirodela intermedia]CAA7392165.1 unnamed protein product [Spirodela intermedia]
MMRIRSLVLSSNPSASHSSTADCSSRALITHIIGRPEASSPSPSSTS